MAAFLRRAAAALAGKARDGGWGLCAAKPSILKSCSEGLTDIVWHGIIIMEPVNRLHGLKDNRWRLAFRLPSKHIRIYERPDRFQFMAGQVELHSRDNIKTQSPVAFGGSKRNRHSRS